MNKQVVPFLLLAFGTACATAVGCSDTNTVSGADAAADVVIDTAPPVDAGPQISCGITQTACGESCFDLSRDEQHCGSCGKACALDEKCESGACKLSCPTGLTACGSACTNPATDRANCGACGTACAAGEVCTAGKCALSCSAGLTTCKSNTGDYCAKVSNDRDNCGACGTKCGAGEVCEAGACKLQCGVGMNECGGACVDYQIDSRNCGACAAADPRAKCNVGQFCTNAVCCTGLQVGCNGVCALVNSDPNNCGACGTVCAGDTKYCIRGACGAIGDWAKDATCNVQAGFPGCETHIGYTFLGENPRGAQCWRFAAAPGWMDAPHNPYALATTFGFDPASAAVEWCRPETTLAAALAAPKGQNNGIATNPNATGPNNVGDCGGTNAIFICLGGN